MNDSPRPKDLSGIIDDFANAPFRLFFLSACLPAIFGALSWALAHLNGGFFATQPRDLQSFFFLQSFAGSALTGFLFTALPRWIGDPTPLGKHMKRLWLIGFFAAVSAPISLPIALSMMMFYWGYMVVLIIGLMWKNRDAKHLSMLIMTATVGLLTLHLATKAWQTELDSYDWQQLLHALILGLALISFRISRALGSQALKDSQHEDSQFVPNPYVKNLSIWLFYLLLVHNLLVQNSIMEGWLSLAVAGALLGRLRDWHFAVLLKKHYVRWLYIATLMIAIGYAWRGLALIELGASPWLDPVLPLEIITISGFLLMFYQIFNIVGLRHSNRDLRYPWTSRLGLMTLLLAGIARAAGSLLLPQYYLQVNVYLPCMLTVLAFSLYFLVFYRLFLRYEATVPVNRRP